ncbi:ornithine carbamoyltransferase [Lactobacillus salsicarnum]|nr:ornithine carbamoyltransferase [Companilactobacillus mishanensis]
MNNFLRKWEEFNLAYQGKETSVFQGRSFLKEIDYTPSEFEYLVDFGLHLKALKKQGIPHHYLEGKNIALLFEKTSTRTRSAFTTSAVDLGAHPEFLGSNDIQLNKKESVEDTAKVLGSMFDGIEFRGFKQQTVEDLAKYSGVPVWNGLTDEWHPTQMIADFMTVKETFGKLKGITLSFVGDGRNNMANSFLVAGSMLGVNIHIVAPKELFPADDVVKLAKGYADKSGSKIVITDDLDKGVRGTNVIYTDVWVSMGEEDQWAERIKLLKPYQVNMDLMKKAKMPDDQLIFMHCLPAFHDVSTEYAEDIKAKYGLTEMEVTDEVFRSKYARQFEEAENRQHSIKAIMAATLGNLFIPKA